MGGQSIGRPTLGFSSGRNLGIVGLTPRWAPHLAQVCLRLYLCLPLPSNKKINKSLKNNIFYILTFVVFHRCVHMLKIHWAVHIKTCTLVIYSYTEIKCSKKKKSQYTENKIRAFFFWSWEQNMPLLCVMGQTNLEWQMMPSFPEYYKTLRIAKKSTKSLLSCWKRAISVSGKNEVSEIGIHKLRVAIQSTQPCKCGTVHTIRHRFY